MSRRKVSWLQATAEALLEAADAEATTHRLHARRFPHGVADGVDFRVMGYTLLDVSLLSRQLPDRRRCREGLLHIGPVEQARSCVDPAVDAEPTLR